MPVDSNPAAAIRAPLARLRAYVRAYLLLEGAVEFVTALIVAGLLQLALDRWLRFSPDQRALLNSVITLLWLWIVYQGFFRRLSVPLSDRLLAARVDAAHPELHDKLTTAVEFAVHYDQPAGGPMPGGASAALVRQLLAEMHAKIGQLPVLDILNHARARRRAIQLTVLLAIVALAFALPATRPMMLTWFARNWLVQDIAWPQQTHILPIGFDEQRARRLPRGDEVEIKANVEGPIPDRATLTWWTASGRSGSETMTIEGGKRLLVSLGPLTENLRFRITGGDERTREFTLEAIETPHVVHTAATITPPAYTGAEPVTIEQQTVLEILSGSTLTLRITLNKPGIQRARLTGANDAALEFDFPTLQNPSDPSIALLRWPSPASGTYRLELEDRDGWKDRNPVRYTLKVVADKPPIVKMDAVGVGELITPTAAILIAIECEDPYGIAAAGLHLRRNDDPERVRAFVDFTEGTRRYNARTAVEVAALDAQIGDKVRIWPEASDLDPAGPNIGRAAPLEVRVVSNEDFLADSARRELELRREFEQVLSAQRSLQDAFRRLASGFASEESAGAAAQRLQAIARQQQSHAARCLTLAQRFGQILAEMRTSRVARAADERRIAEHVIAPMETLSRNAMPDAASALLELKSRLDTPAADAAAAALDDVMRLMRGVLANMLQREGYREAVDLLREIISEQGEIHEETLRAVERELQQLLELDLPPPDSQNPPRKP